MPKAKNHLEIMQVCKLLQCVRNKDMHQIKKLTSCGVPCLINYIEPSEGDNALSIAAIYNDDDMMQFLLELGAHPDVMDLKGKTAAMRTVEYGHVNCLEKLLAAKANMTLTDQEGKGIIFYCIANTERHAKCLELALTNGADVNNKSIKEGMPVFLLACETAMDNQAMCMTLLERGADPKSKICFPEPQFRPDGRPYVKYERTSNAGRTALMAACQSGSGKVVKAILSRGGEVNCVDIRKNHAAHFAAMGGHLDCLMCMAGYGAQFDQVNTDANTPIHLAAMGGYAMCCKFLSQRGCNPKPKNNGGFTGRALAKEDGHKEASKELRKAEKTFGRVGRYNDPWMVALYDWIIHHQEDLIVLLKEQDPEDAGIVEREAFMNIMQCQKAPVEAEELHRLAVQHDRGREGVVEYMEFFTGKKWVSKNYLMSAFEPKKKKKKGGKKGGKKKGKFKLIMPICTRDEGPRMVGGNPPEMYIHQHFNFTDTSRFDRDYPPKHPLQDDSAWYLQHPDRVHININDAAKDGDFDSLKLALKKGVSIDTRDKFYKTALMTASAAGHLNMVKFLVQNGASVNVRDNFKWTPLHHACHAGQLDVVQYLVDNGGEIDAPTMNGGTPLTRAIESSRNQVVHYLIDHGVKMRTENRKGMTPMDIAEAWADPRVLSIVEAKWETLPPVQDKGRKGKGKRKGSPKGKRPVSAPGEKEGDLTSPKSPQHFEFMVAGLHHKRSILRAASVLAGGLAECENITYDPLRAWTQLPTTQELVWEKEVRRERFGWEVDFHDFQMPFLKNVADKLEALEKENL